MYSCSPTLNQISLKNSTGNVVFQILVTWLFSRNENSFFGRHFETQHFFNVLFADLWLFQVYTYMVQVSYRNSYGKVPKNEWVQVDPPPLCTNEGET